MPSQQITEHARAGGLVSRLDELRGKLSTAQTADDQLIAALAVVELLTFDGAHPPEPGTRAYKEVSKHLGIALASLEICGPEARAVVEFTHPIDTYRRWIPKLLANQRLRDTPPPALRARGEVQAITLDFELQEAPAESPRPSVLRAWAVIASWSVGIVAALLAWAID
jgi:hypothetical protein